jgi:putative ABC transport system substrate-binding protein
MRRRDLIALWGGAGVLLSRAARAQDAGRTYRLGVLSASRREAPEYVAFFDELRRQGFVEGVNLVVDPQGFGVMADRADAVAAAVAGARPDAIVCNGSRQIGAMQRSTQSIPILASSGADYQTITFGDSLARPRGNTTGVSILSSALNIKRQEILLDLVHGADRMAALVDANASGASHAAELQQFARRRGVAMSIHRVHRADEIERAIESARSARAQALNVLSGPLFYTNRATLIAQVAAARLPAIYEFPEIATAGGLAAYGARLTMAYRQLARQGARVLRGTRPADIPVEQPTTFELIVNLTAARAIGLAIPSTVLARADEVIE